MADLIDRAVLKRHYAWWGDTDERRLFDDIVDAQPTVDAVPVVHGRWIYPLGMAWNYVCSECGANGGVIGSNYCPNCGAIMDGRKEQG